MEPMASTQRLIYDRSGPFRVSCIWALMMLVGQFLLGMWTNLFVSIPAHHAGSSTASSGYLSHGLQSDIWALQHASPVLRAHIILGILIVIGALYTIWAAARARHGSLLAWAIVAAIGIIVAGIQGASFLVFSEDVSSMIMSGGFALGMVSYAVGLYLAR
ncbi:MAG: hypothetical protein ACRDFS_07325 [Chloroflexota bacterium]